MTCWSSASISGVLKWQACATVFGLCTAGDGTRGFMHARQAFYQLSYISTPIFPSYRILVHDFQDTFSESLSVPRAFPSKMEVVVPEGSGIDRQFISQLWYQTEWESGSFALLYLPFLHTEVPHSEGVGSSKSLVSGKWYKEGWRQAAWGHYGLPSFSWEPMLLIPSTLGFLNQYPTYPTQSPGQRFPSPTCQNSIVHLCWVCASYTQSGSLPDTRCLLSKGQHLLLCANELLSQLKTCIFYNFHFSPFSKNENRVITAVGHLESVPAFILHRLLNNTKIAHSTSHWVMKSLTFLG